MLLNLHKKTWMDGLTLAEYSEHSRLNEQTVSEMLELAKNYNKVIVNEGVYVDFFLTWAIKENTFFIKISIS